MKDDNFKVLMDEAFPDEGGKAPQRKMWTNIRARVPIRDPQTGWFLRNRVPVGATGLVGLVLALVLVFGPSARVPQTPADGLVTEFALEALQSSAPKLYEQNKPALEALAAAILEIQRDMETRPEDSLLQRRLQYYQNWRNEMISGLLNRNRNEGSHATS